jgi:hypothetical protein
MSRPAKKLLKEDVDILLHDQGVTLDQPFVEGRTFRASFRDSQGLAFTSSVSHLLTQPRKNYSSGALAIWLKVKSELNLRINELESTNSELKLIVTKLSATKKACIDILRERDLLREENAELKKENALLKKTLDESW